MRRLAITLGALVLGCLGVEVWVRAAFREEWDASIIRSRQADAAFAPLVRFSDDPVLYYELRPDLDIAVLGSRLVTDATGCRIRTQPREHEPECEAGARPLRVAVLGPSTALGFGVAAEQSYPELLAAEMERLWRRPVELRNYSAPGYNTLQEARLFELRALPWQPDLVLWHYDHRDVSPVIAAGRRIELPPDFGDNVLHSAAWKFLARRRQVAALEALRLGAGNNPLVEGYVTSGPLWERHLLALEQVAGAADDRGIPVILVLFDALVSRGAAGRDHLETLHAPLVPELQALGLHVIDMYARCQAEIERQGRDDLDAFWLSIKPRDAHPNAAGHAFLAASISAWLEKHAELAPANQAAGSAGTGTTR